MLHENIWSSTLYLGLKITLYLHPKNKRYRQDTLTENSQCFTSALFLKEAVRQFLTKEVIYCVYISLTLPLTVCSFTSNHYHPLCSTYQKCMLNCIRRTRSYICIHEAFYLHYSKSATSSQKSQTFWLWVFVWDEQCGQIKSITWWNSQCLWCTTGSYPEEGHVQTRSNDC